MLALSGQLFKVRRRFVLHSVLCSNSVISLDVGGSHAHRMVQTLTSASAASTGETTVGCTSSTGMLVALSYCFCTKFVTCQSWLTLVCSGTVGAAREAACKVRSHLHAVLLVHVCMPCTCRDSVALFP